MIGISSGIILGRVALERNVYLTVGVLFFLIVIIQFRSHRKHSMSPHEDKFVTACQILF
jgi:hypothetical protein